MEDLDKKNDVNAEEMDMLFRGIRPENIPYDKFKEYRSLIKKNLKDALKGRWFFISSTPELKDGKPTGNQLTQTYKK